MQDIVAGVRSKFLLRGRSGNKEEWFLKKIQGEEFGKRLSARSGVGMKSKLLKKMSGPGFVRPGTAFALSLK